MEESQRRPVWADERDIIVKQLECFLGPYIHSVWTTQNLMSSNWDVETKHLRINTEEIQKAWK